LPGKKGGEGGALTSKGDTDAALFMVTRSMREGREWHVVVIAFVTSTPRGNDKGSKRLHYQKRGGRKNNIRSLTLRPAR